jgi:hypothetical protein
MNRKYQPLLGVIPFLVIVFLLIWKTYSPAKAVPDEQLIIRPAVQEVFHSLHRDSVLLFQNENGQQMLFKMGEIDSSVYNKKAFLMSPVPMRSAGFAMRRLLPYKFFDDQGSISMYKTSADSISHLHIIFQGFWHLWEDTLPAIHYDTLQINNKIITNYSTVHTTAYPRAPGDITDIIITKTAGIVAFRDSSGQYWTLRQP